MIDRWQQQQQQLMNSSYSLCLGLDRRNNCNNSCSYSSSSSNNHHKNHPMKETSSCNQQQQGGGPPPVPVAVVPVERKNSIGLMDALLAPIIVSSSIPTVPNAATGQQHTTTVDDVWNNIIASRPVTCKQEEPDTMMTLEDFLAKAAVDNQPQQQEEDVKPLPERLLSGRMLSFDIPPDEDDITTTGGKRTRHILDPLQDKAAQQRQRRMIKNRESAARSRERKQAYQAELESLAYKLEEENETLMKAKEEQTRTRYKQLMDNIIPVTEKRRPTRYVLKKVRSMEW